MMKTALLFAGQGSQTGGMGRDLRKICFEGPEDVLTRTDNTQPGIFLTSLACLAALKTQVPNWEFSATAGLSLGEFTALTAAEAMGFGDALRLIQARARFMQEACEATGGGMAAIMGMDDTALAEVCREVDVDIANLNCPAQTVISGEKDRIAKAVELARARGAKRAVPLTVAGAYHSRLMETARGKLATELAKVPVHLPRVPVVSNVTARPAASVSEIKELLVRQVTSSVRWSDSMQWLIGQGFTRFIELGPGQVLSGLMKRINKDVKMLSVSDSATLDATIVRLSA